MRITEENWKRIRKFWGDAARVSASAKLPYCVFATVNEDGSPRLAPYGSLILQENKSGFYFDRFSRHTSQNLNRDQRICVLLLKTDKWFWMKALLLGRFDHAPGIRLMGTVGSKREADTEEISAFRKPLRRFRIFKGYQPLWGTVKHGREIHFESFETVNCGPMKYLEAV